MKTVLGWVPVVLRILLGAMLMMSGWTWLTRPDIGGYLADQLALMFELGGTVPAYRPFLTEIVVPNAPVFGLLVGLGEFLSGVSLFFGVAARIGASVASFQFLNYGLMGGYGSLAAHGVLILGLLATIRWKAGRKLGLDGPLSRRWPDVPVW